MKKWINGNLEEDRMYLCKTKMAIIFNAIYFFVNIQKKITLRTVFGLFYYILLIINH